VSNLFEVGCGLVGAIIILHSLANKSFAMDMMGQELEISQGQRIAIGVALLLFGLAVPGLVNWFVASARDANLFS
jgi:intracellular septation protein A